MNRQIKLFLFEGVDPVLLDSYRRCLAVAFSLYMLYLYGNASEWLTDYGFHVTARTQLLPSARPWPTMENWLVPIFGVALFGSALCLIFGRFTRVASFMAMACALYVHRVDSLTAFALNKLFIVGFTILAFAPPVREVRLSDGRRVQLQSAWPVRVLQATLIIIYFTSGICKGFYGDWLRHTDVVWSIVHGVFRTDFSSFMLQSMPKWIFSIIMYLVLAFEIFAPVLFINKKLRPYGVMIGIAFHLGLSFMMSTVIFFSMQMMSYYALFLTPETLHKIRDWMKPPKSEKHRLQGVESVVYDDSVPDEQKVQHIRRILEAEE